MKLNALINELRKHDIKLWLDHEQLRFSAPKGIMSEAFRDQIIEHKTALVNFLQQQEPLPQPSKLNNKSELLSTSSAQKRLWFLDQINTDNKSLHINSLLDIRGELNTERLRESFQYIASQHDVLHSCFKQSYGGVSQQVKPVKNISLHKVVGLKSINEIHAYLKQNQPTFDLTEGKLYQALLFELSPERYVLFLSIHHIACDGISINLLAKKIMGHYQSNKTGTVNLEQNQLDYFDYAHWQQSLAKLPQIKKELSYWQQQLCDIDALSLPTDRPRPSVASNTGGSFYQTLNADLSQQIKTQALTLKCTTFDFLLSSFASVLNRYCQQDNFSIGIPVNGRINPIFENTIGCFINILPITVDFSNNPTFSELCLQTQSHCHQAYNNQTLSFEQIVEAVNPQRNIASTPIFQTMFSMQESHREEALISGLRVKPLLMHKYHSQYELSLFANEDDNGTIVLEWVYRSDLFEQSRIKKISQCFELLLEAISSQPQQHIRSINLISNQDIKQYQQRWMYSFHDFGKAQRIESLFSQQALATPMVTAISVGEEKISYQQLEQRSNALAFLLSKQNSPVIGIHLERSIEQCICILATLKSGAAYLPIETSQPTKRINDIISDANLTTVITSEKNSLTKQLNTNYLLIEELHLERISREKPTQSQANHLFNVIYTSGSTGSPKGVMISHQAIFNRLNWMQKAFDLKAGEKVLHKTSFSFDVSVWEIFWPLLNGGHIVLAHAQGHKNPAYISALITSKDISYCHFVPSMLSAFLQEPSVSNCNTLKTVFCSGEILKKQQVQNFYQQLPESGLYNLYGPTEAAIDVSFHACSPSDKTIPIGKAISNTQLQLINEDGLLSPDGAIGEISIGGSNLAEGYFNNPNASKKAFINNPLQQYGHPSNKLYRTGDLGFFDKNGDLHFTGRLDDQVKIRGFRVELSEVENACLAHTKVHDVFVRALKDKKGNAQLVAYYITTTTEKLTSHELQHFLKSQLPSYMLPTHLIDLQSWPLKENGKKLLSALPVPAGIRHSHNNYVAPRNDIEKALQEIWQELLNVDKVSIYDNFFELGGHSLLAVQALNLGQKSFEVTVQLSDVLSDPTIATAARAIHRAQSQKNILSQQHHNGNDDEEIII